MATHSQQGLVKKQGLTPSELAEIKLLADICNAHEGLDLKLNWSILEQREQDQTNDFLYYEDGVLVSFLPLFNFNSTEAEISGMVHPAYRRRNIAPMAGISMVLASCQTIKDVAMDARSSRTLSRKSLPEASRLSPSKSLSPIKTRSRSTNHVVLRKRAAMITIAF